MEPRTASHPYSFQMTRWLLFLLTLTTTSTLFAQGTPFRQAKVGYDYQFPRDHGSHPDFKLEWWYLTGHLKSTSTGRRFGFQATFFRTAISEEASTSEFFDTTQGFLAHMALLDIQTGKLHVEERLNRQGWDAQASTQDLDVRNGNWTLKRTPSEAHAETMTIQASIRSNARMKLTLTPTKPKVIFGQNGISRKSATSEAASHYITFTRLRTTGTVSLLGETFSVEGETWMDHEFSSSQLSEDQTGWDWASIRLNDGRDIMLYRLRQRSGGIDPFSQLTWVDKESKQTRLKPKQWSWKARRQWNSPHTKATYPIDIDVQAIDPASGNLRRLRLRPLIEDQEIVGKLDALSYWEGACDVLDESDAVIGQAYVELAGYDGRLTERLR